MDTIEKSGISEHGPDDIDTSRAREKVFATTKVNVAFPFSQVKIQEPSEHLIALTACPWAGPAAGLSSPGRRPARTDRRTT